MRRFLVLILAVLFAAPAFAQATVQGGAGTPVPAPQKPADWDQRLALSKKIHELRPASEEVQSVVNHLAQHVPAANREAFKQKILGEIDDRKLEDTSINAMAQTFTMPELQKMYEYDSSPEAKSISDKMPIYQQLVQPVLMQMLDKAMMDAKVGANSPDQLPTTPPGGYYTRQSTAPTGMMSTPALPHGMMATH